MVLVEPLAARVAPPQRVEPPARAELNRPWMTAGARARSQEPRRRDLPSASSPRPPQSLSSERAHGDGGSNGVPPRPNWSSLPKREFTAHRGLHERTNVTA